MKPYYEDKKAGIVLYHGDCRDVLPTIAAGSVDLVLTDPPYGISHSSNHGATWRGTEIANDHDEAMRDWVIDWATGLPMFVFGSWKTTTPTGTRGVLVWDKGPAFGMGDLSFPWKMSHEFVYVIGDGFIGRRDEGVLKGHIQVSWESKGRTHPHQKPLTLIQALAAKHPGKTVLDPFSGSGTTLVAAKLLGKHAIGIECDEAHCETTANRLRQEVLQFGE